MAVVVAIDAGTTGVRSVAVRTDGAISSRSYRELTQHFPRPGWVEHDAGEIFALVEETLVEVCDELAAAKETIAAVGIANQRETAVAWDRSSGEPLQRAIVWQDRRTAARCRELEIAGHLPLLRSRTGLVADSYFTAPKWEWMFSEGGLQETKRLCLGTVDDWLCWKLTGLHVTDATNASRTLCYDITEHRWSGELCELFGLKKELLGELRPSSGRIAPITSDLAGGRLSGVPLSSLAGDQQAALFGQGCTKPGATKATYGTGTFVLMNLGSLLPPPREGLLTTVACQLVEDERSADYALEGSVFSSGAALRWLRDGLGVVSSEAELGPLAESVPTSEGVFVVPAFTGLGSPWWDPSARAVIGGLTRGVGRAQLARAVVQAIAFQVRDVTDAMVEASGMEIRSLRVDGGASAMDLLCQLQADQCQLAVVRPATTEVTVLGAAFLAGLAEGVWTLSDLAGLGGEERRFEPSASKSRADTDHARWLDALWRSRARASEGADNDSPAHSRKDPSPLSSAGRPE